MQIISGVNPEGQNIPPTQGVERKATAKIGIGKKVRQLMGSLSEKFGPSDSFRWGIHMAVDHMGQGSWKGNFSSFATGQTGELLTKRFKSGFVSCF